jgi:hypothetical protein
MFQYFLKKCFYIFVSSSSTISSKPPVVGESDTRLRRRWAIAAAHLMTAVAADARQGSSANKPPGERGGSKVEDGGD